MKKITFLLAIACLLMVSAQGAIVTGFVRDAVETLPCATIKIKGTSQGVLTDLDGYFSIEVTTPCILEFWYCTYDAQEIEITGDSYLDVTLVEASYDLLALADNHLLFRLIAIIRRENITA